MPAQELHHPVLPPGCRPNFNQAGTVTTIFTRMNVGERAPGVVVVPVVFHTLAMLRAVCCRWPRTAAAAAAAARACCVSGLRAT